jgi:hypothetical protein
MPDTMCQEFQEVIGRYLGRHRSVLDVMSKLQEATSRTNRAVAKAVTTCGCIRVTAEKQSLPPDADYRDMSRFARTHIEGQLCETCRETLESEIGIQLLYLGGLCEILGLALGEVLESERDRLAALGPFYFC